MAHLCSIVTSACFLGCLRKFSKNMYWGMGGGEVFLGFIPLASVGASVSKMVVFTCLMPQMGLSE